MKQPLFSVTKKDLTITWFSGKKGGQHVNKHPNCCRIQHKESNSTVVCKDHRERSRNQREAFLRLVKSQSFVTWHRKKCAMLMQDMVDLDAWVEDQMKPENLKVETYTP